MSKHKKTQQLGMNPSTASGRLVKDTLFRLVVEAGHKCYRCGGELTRESFSIEHKVPWLDSEEPRGLFFDQDNIAFSHLACNCKASRNTRKGVTKYPEFVGVSEKRSPSEVAADHRRKYCPQKRKEKYFRTGT